MSRSIRKETSSLAFGIVGRFGGSSAGFVVAALNAASAASREVVVLLVPSAGIIMSSRQGFTLLNANWAAKVAVAYARRSAYEGVERRGREKSKRRTTGRWCVSQSAQVQGGALRPYAPARRESQPSFFAHHCIGEP